VREAALSPGQAALLGRFGEVGGCVEYVLLDCNPAAGEDVTSAATHRRAAVLGLEVIRERLAEYARETSRTRGIPVQDFFAVTINHERAASMTGVRLSCEEFLGPRYDPGRGLLTSASGSTAPDGYAYAFSDPPYSLYDRVNRRRLSDGEPAELFQAINRDVLGGVTPASVVYRWPDDWSNYFDAGKEWWGSFCWTFANPGTARVVVLAASTTD
jgi:hypothetical protein